MIRSKHRRRARGVRFPFVRVECRKPTMSSDSQRPVQYRRREPANAVYDVTEGLMGVDAQFLKAVKTNVQKMLLSDDLEMPRISGMAARIMRIASDPNVNIDRIVELVQTDAFLAGKILTMLNSAYFAMREEVTSLRHAIVLLGLKAVGDLIFSVSMRIKIFKCPEYEKLMTKFWEHSIGVAVASEVIAQLRGMGKGSAADPGFMAGLLHDVGKPLILEAVVRAEDQLRRRQRIGEEAVIQLVDELHVQVGMLVARKWKTGDDIAAAIEHHANYNPDAGRLSHFVYCGNRITHHLGFGYRQEEFSPNLDACFTALDLASPQTFDEITGVVRRHADRLLHSF